MATVESDLPPSIPHPIADATDTLHASNAVKGTHEPEFVDNQPLVTDANDTSSPEVTKLAPDNAASTLLDASLGSRKPADLSEYATHKNTNNTSIAGETAMTTVSPNDIEARDIPESTIASDKSATQDSLMENNAKAEDAGVTEQAPADLLSSNLSTATTEKTADAVPVSETIVLGGSKDEQASGSVEIKGDPVPSNDVEEPVVGQGVTETASNKPNEKLEEEKTAIVAETDLAEKDDTAENDLVIEDAEATAVDKEAPVAETASTVESQTLEGEATTSVEQNALEAEPTDHSTAEDVLSSDKEESKVEADQAGVEVEERVVESTEGGVLEEPVKVEPKEANGHEDNSVEPAVAGQSEESEPTETLEETTAASSLADETLIPAVSAVENSDLETSKVEISADPKETLSDSVASNEEKTSKDATVPQPDAEPQAAVEENAPLLKEEAVESITATANEASIEEKEVAYLSVDEQAANNATEPLVESQSHPAAEVEADVPTGEPAVPGGEDNVPEVTNTGAEPVVEEVGEITPESTPHEVTEQEATVEASNKPVIDDATQQTPAEQPSPEGIATPDEAEVAEQFTVETAADLVSEAPVPSEVTFESVVDTVEKVPIVEETTDVQKTDVEHDVLVGKPPAADLAPIQGGEEQPPEKVEAIVEEQAAPVMEVSQDEKDGVAAEAPTTEAEKVLVEETSVEANEAAVEETPAEVEMAEVEDIPTEVETTAVDESPAGVKSTVVEEKPVVEEVPAEAEAALIDEAPASAKTDVQEDEKSELVVEEEPLTEAPTTIEGEKPQMNEAVVDVKEEVTEKVTETVSEQTIVNPVPEDKDTAEVPEPVDVPASENDAVETPAGAVDEKEEIAVEQDVEQVGESEQVQHIPSVTEGEDTMLETAEISASAATVPVDKAEPVVEEANEAFISKNVAAKILAAENPGEDLVEASIDEGKQDSEEPKAGTVEQTVPHDQQSEAVVSHEIGDTGAVDSKDSTREAVPRMEDSLVSEVSEADTTTETIIVPEPVAQKKLDSAGPTVEEIGAPHLDEAQVLVHEDNNEGKLQLNIPRDGTPVERPKSPWTPSFQVTTIGQGVSLPPEDILVHPLNGAEETMVIPSEEASVAVNESSNEVPVNLSPDESEKDEVKSTSSLWTPSYSVHSQGSPNPPHATLEPENLATADKEVEAETDVLAVEQTLVHEDVVPSVTEEPEPEHVESQSTEAEQAEEVAVETINVAEEPIAVLEDATPESPVIKEPLNEDLMEEISIPVPTILEQDTTVIHASREDAPEEEVQTTLETAPAESQDLEQHNAEDDSSLTAPTHQSGSASPSWIPSYSVSRQGSPLHRPVALPSAEISEIRLAPPQSSNLVQEDMQDDVLIDAASSVTAPTVVVDGAEVAEVEKAQPTEDRPSTPWTPSYSVTVQGPDVLDETAIESLSPPAEFEKAKEPEVRQRRSLSEEMESGAFSPTALIGAGFAGGAAVYAASAALRNSNDGRRSTDVAEPQTQQEKHFPTVEIPDGNKHHTAPRVDGNETSHTTVTRSPETSPISSRKRLESTTSSRLFPGGWFSTSATIPDERTSLEVAQGEFTGAKQGGSAEGCLQSPTSPAAELITPVREQSSSDKRKWCIIM